MICPSIELNTGFQVNEAVTEAENNKLMLKVVKKFEGYKEEELISPGRSFIMEGELLKVCRKESKKRTFFLFSDLLLYAYPTTAKYKIGKRFALRHVSVQDVEDPKGCTFQIKSDAKSFNTIAPVRVLQQ
jgi:FYVE/RhoGEF/PH domain-containing protein 5/6